ncbi:hypothetical protein NDU88_000685 [Pleurodeles waltl]|uniref:Uncharacterized protein n=1 Tax=Pleurodeles waltl TaxID=8319 RepID=A0AAV7Q4U2_PLEWA|nr:hypothetical protein NDU88_000685 [Pleurodeles waltl]
MLLFIVPTACGRLGLSRGSHEQPLQAARARRRYSHRSSPSTRRAGGLSAPGPRSGHAEGNDDQPVREPRGPESPSPAAAQSVSRRRAPHKAQSRKGCTASGGGARAITPPPSDPRDAGAPELRCLTVPRGVSPLQRRALEVRGRGRPTAPGSELTRRGCERRLSRPSAPLRRPR